MPTNASKLASYVGAALTADGKSGIVTATAYYGDGSNLTGVSGGSGSAGLGTAISDDTTSPLNKIYYTNQVLSIGSTVTVDVPASAQIGYTQYADILIDGDADLIIADNDDFVPDILGIATGSNGLLAGGNGKLRVDNLTNKAGTGAPTFPNGAVVTGVVTATSFSGDGSALTGVTSWDSYDTWLFGGG